MVLIGSPPPRPTGRLPPRVSAADQPDQQPPPHHRGADLSRNHPIKSQLTSPPHRAAARSATADVPCSNTFDASRPPRLDGGKWSGGSVRRRSAEKHARRRPSKAGQPERTRGSARALPKRHAISREQTPHTARAAESGPQPYAVIHCRSSDDIRNDGGRPRPIVNTVDWLPQWHRREAA